MGILTTESTSWLGAVPVFCVAVMLLYLPGLLTMLFARTQGVAALAVAPLLSTAYLTVGAIAYALLGVRWTPKAVVPGLIIAALLGGLILRRLNPGKRRGGRGAVMPTAFGLLIAAIVALQSIRGAIPSPSSFPQQPDTIYHLGAAQWMLETGDASVLHAAGFDHPRPGFYPAAFHDFTASTAMLTGSSVAVATSAFVLAVVLLTWPLGCIFLALTVFPNRPLVPILAALLSVSFTGFPYLLMGAGVLWPNLFGQALLPAALALVLTTVGSAKPNDILGNRILAATLLLPAVPAVTVAHPNALVALGLFTSIILLCQLPRIWVQAADSARRNIAIGKIVAIAALLACALAVLSLRPHFMFGNGKVGPQYSAGEAWRQTLLFAPDRSPSLLVLALLVAAGGAILAIRASGSRWIVCSLLATLALFWLNLAVDSELVRYFTWPWYNVGARLQAVAIIPAILAALGGILFLFDKSLSIRLFTNTRTVAAPAAIGTLLAGIGFAYTGPHRETLQQYYRPPASETWATSGELRSLRTLAHYLPDNAVVAANPWKGGTYLYVVSGRHLLVPTEKVNSPGDRQLLSLRLDEIGTDPVVCAAAERQNVEWALVGGKPNVHAGKRNREYRGIDAVGESPAWRQVARAKPFTLYQRVACAH